MLKRVIIAITGATGCIYGIRLLQVLAELPDIETHLILSPAGLVTAEHETGFDKKAISVLADECHRHKDFGASISSGSFPIHSMVVAPCSMNTLGSIAHGLDNNLISRAAGVTLKERRTLVLLPRETPLHLVHLRNMTIVTEMGGIIAPPVPSFYQHPANIEDLINHTVGRTLDSLGIDAPNLVQRWQGLHKSPGEPFNKP
ncbi:3-octaprenyl-4-hydroxybenzoate carboxy-lyase [Gammaproteobacteria bacterium 54_18_T64]|nr:3-octaprenyl-4-hydroxybenzoate carboxy-lyase [Gammaproteobacteria bacterium 54_18_T64]